MKAKPPVVAILGAGSAGGRHALAFQAAGAKVIPVPARPERVKELEGAAATLEDAAARGAKSCVIATDTGRHEKDALAALALGLDILVEKPLAADAAAARRVFDAALGRRAFTGCVLRFSRSLAVFRELLPRLGRVADVQIECRSYLPDWRPGRPYRESYSARAAEGGVLRDLIHEIDYAGWLLGWPQSVEGRLANTGALGIESEEEAELSWSAPSGCRVAVKLDYLTKPPRRTMTARGVKGTLAWDGIAQTVTFAGKTESYPQTPGMRFLAQARAFLSRHEDDRLASLDDGLRAVEICDAARRSSASRKKELVS